MTAPDAIPVTWLAEAQALDVLRHVAADLDTAAGVEDPDVRDAAGALRVRQGDLCEALDHCRTAPLDDTDACAAVAHDTQAAVRRAAGALYDLRVAINQTSRGDL